MLPVNHSLEDKMADPCVASALVPKSGLNRYSRHRKRVSRFTMFHEIYNVLYTDS